MYKSKTKLNITKKTRRDNKSDNFEQGRHAEILQTHTTAF